MIIILRRKIEEQTMQGIIQHTKLSFDIYTICLQLKFMPMNDLLKTRLFTLLTDTSVKVTNADMQDAYEEYIKYIVVISNSEDCTHIFRMLNLTRIEIAPLKELYQYEQGEKCA